MVNIIWEEPFDQGSPITGYRIYVRESDELTFTEDLTDCNRLDLATVSCTIPVITLKTTPFEIPWGESIWARIVAINDYGISATSEAGNGAIIITYPDAPVSFMEDYSQRTATSLMLTWLEGPDNGGSTVISYQLTYDDTSITNFVILEDTILDTFYDVQDLTPGLTYRFKV